MPSMLNDIYQSIDPIAFAVGPFAVRWYGIAYILGFICAGLVIWRTARRWSWRNGWRRGAIAPWAVRIYRSSP